MVYKPTALELRQTLENDNKVIHNLPRKGFPHNFSFAPAAEWKLYLNNTKLTAEQLYSLFRHLEREKPEFYRAKKNDVHLIEIQKLIMEKLNTFNQKISENMKKDIKINQKQREVSRPLLKHHLQVKPKYPPPIPSIDGKFESGTKIYKEYEEYVNSLKDKELGAFCLSLSEEDVNYLFLEKVDKMIEKRATQLGMAKIPTLADDIRKIKNMTKGLSVNPFGGKPSKK